MLIFLTPANRKVSPWLKRVFLSIFIFLTGLGSICRADELPQMGFAERLTEELASEGHTGGKLVLNNLADSKTLLTADFAFVFVHGLWGHSLQFADRPADMLKLADRAIFARTFNLPGHSEYAVSEEALAETRKKDKEVNAHVWSSYLETEVKIAKKFAKHVILVGQSTGGLLALRLLHTHPDLVDGVIAIDPALGVRPMLAFGSCLAKVTRPGSESWGPLPELVIGQKVPRLNLGFGCEVEKLTHIFQRELGQSFGIDANNPGLLFKAFGRKFRGKIKVIGTELDQVVNPGWISVLGKSADPETFVAAKTRFGDGKTLRHGEVEYLSADLKARVCELVARVDPELKDQGCFTSDDLLVELISPSLNPQAELDFVRAAKSDWKTAFHLDSQAPNFSSELIKRDMLKLSMGKDSFEKLARFFRLQTAVYKKWNDLVDDNVPSFVRKMELNASKVSQETNNRSQWPISILMKGKEVSEINRKLLPYCHNDELSGTQQTYQTIGRLNREHCVLSAPILPPSKSRSADLEKWEKSLFSPELLDVSGVSLKQICSSSLTGDCENVVRAHKAYRQQLNEIVQKFKRELLQTFNQDSQVIEYLQLREGLSGLLHKIKAVSSGSGILQKSISTGVN